MRPSDNIQEIMPSTIHADAFHFDHPVQSYWEASATPLDIATPPLSGDARCDVAVIGGGYTGLAAALRLKTEYGVDVRILEAAEPGWGASGRNGGFACIGSHKRSYASLIKSYGLDDTRRFYATMKDAVALVGDVCRRHGIDAWIHDGGEISLAHLPGRWAELEEERDHVLGKRTDAGTWTEEDALVAEALRERNNPDLLVDDQLSFEALESEATFDRVLFDGVEHGTGVAPGTPEEEDFLGIPGLLDADQVHDLLRSKRGAPAKPVSTAAPAAGPSVADVKALKKELGDCVRAYARQTGASQAAVHADLRRACGGPEVPRASAAELRARIDKVRAWAVGRR